MLHLKEKAKQQIIFDSFRTFPDECCGFLFGLENGDERVIEEILIVNNAKKGDKRRRFEITPKDYMYAERYAENHQLSLLGIYHSHPNHPSIPSELDRLQAQPYFSYIIVSVLEYGLESIQSWRLNEFDQFDEEEIQTNDLFQLHYSTVSGTQLIFSLN